MFNPAQKDGNKAPETPSEIPEIRPPVDDSWLPTWKDSASLKDLDFIETASGAFHGGPGWKSRGYALMAWSFAATVIDACVVVGLVCLFLFVGLWIDRVSAGALMSFDQKLLLRAGLLLFVFLHMSYLLSLRIVLGSSLGEWACGLRLGEPRQRLSPRYSLQVLFRFLIVVGTGIFSLPILSYLTGQDWAGRLSGLPLISIQKNPKAP